MVMQTAGDDSGSRTMFAVEVVVGVCIRSTIRMTLTFLTSCVAQSKIPLYFPPSCRRDLMRSKGNENAAAVNPAVN